MEQSKANKKNGRQKSDLRKIETLGELDKNGVYRLGVPVAAYDIVRHYQAIAGKVSDFIDYVIPFLTEGACSRESIVKILKARPGVDELLAKSSLDSFILAVRSFQTELAQGFSRIDWLDEGERIERLRLANKTIMK